MSRMVNALKLLATGLPTPKTLEPRDVESKLIESPTEATEAPSFVAPDVDDSPPLPIKLEAKPPQREVWSPGEADDDDRKPPREVVDEPAKNEPVDATPPPMRPPHRGFTSSSNRTDDSDSNDELISAIDELDRQIAQIKSEEPTSEKPVAAIETLSIPAVELAPHEHVIEPDLIPRPEVVPPLDSSALLEIATIAAPVEQRQPAAEVKPASEDETPSVEEPAKAEEAVPEASTDPIAPAPRIDPSTVEPLAAPPSITAPLLPDTAVGLLARDLLDCFSDCDRAPQILVTTIDDPSGQHEVAEQLAAALAIESTNPQQDGRDVYLVRPVGEERAHDSLSLQQGLDAVLSGESSWQDAILSGSAEHVWTLSSHANSPAPSNPEFRATLDAMQTEGRFVLVDADPYNDPHAVSFAQRCDGVLLVVRQQETSLKAVREAIAALSRQESPFLGCVLTKAA